jgi:hypothetical protein
VTIEEARVAGPNRTHPSTFAAFFDAGTGLAAIVERVHSRIARRPGPFRTAASDSTRGIIGDYLSWTNPTNVSSPVQGSVLKSMMTAKSP